MSPVCMIHRLRSHQEFPLTPQESPVSSPSRVTLSTLASESTYMWQIPSLWPITGIPLAAFWMSRTSWEEPRGMIRSIILSRRQRSSTSSLVFTCRGRGSKGKMASSGQTAETGLQVSLGAMLRRRRDQSLERAQSQKGGQCDS